MLDLCQIQFCLIIIDLDVGYCVKQPFPFANLTQKCSLTEKCKELMKVESP